MQHSTSYLYGISPDDLAGKEYFEALDYKREAGKRLYAYLYDKRRTSDEDVQLHYVLKALRHTEELINERTAI